MYQTMPDGSIKWVESTSSQPTSNPWPQSQNPFSSAPAQNNPFQPQGLSPFAQGPQQNAGPFARRGPRSQASQQSVFGGQQGSQQQDMTATHWAGVGMGAASGAAIGSAAGPWGTLIGGVVGGAAAGIFALTGNQ